jgi:hypothetical protein
MARSTTLLFHTLYSITKEPQKDDKGHHTSIPYALPKSNKSGQRERLLLKKVQSAKENQMFIPFYTLPNLKTWTLHKGP